MSSYIGMYRYNDSFYTGTLLQPDTLSFFIKKKKNDDFLVCNTEPIANLFGKCVFIIGSFTGIGRIVNSVKSIFQSLSQSSPVEANVIWNSFKNLFRGI